MTPSYEISKILQNYICTGLLKQQNFDKNNMNFISKVFSPRVNLTRIDDEEVAETIPPIDKFKNLNMDQDENT